MKSFHGRGRGFRSQWPRKTRQKKTAKSIVGKSIATATLEQASDFAKATLQERHPRGDGMLRVGRLQGPRSKVRHTFAHLGEDVLALRDHNMGLAGPPPGENFTPR